MSAGRVLNDNQHRCLDRTAEAEPDAIVVGWVDDSEGRGPIVRMPNGEEKFASTTGYLRNLRDE